MKPKNKRKDISKDVVHGPNAIIEMLKAKKRKLYSIYLKQPIPKAWDKVKQYLPKSVPNIQYVNKNTLDGIALTPDHKGIVALVSPFQYTKRMFTPDKKPFVLLLDSIQDVGNLGAILRSAYCAGVDGVVLCQNQAAHLTSTVFAASAGYAEYLDIHISPSISHAVNELKKNGYNLYMAVMDGNDASKVTYKKPLCLVIGNEATGISKNVLPLGQAITIPQRSPEISYNASVAAGILLFPVSLKK
ncbi:MAG: 23S rRNA (guanosine(2251)-2'-O)-methyltransferase RlmB [bacterium]